MRPLGALVLAALVAARPPVASAAPSPPAATPAPLAPAVVAFEDPPSSPHLGWSMAAGLTVAIVPIIIGGSLSFARENTGMPDAGLDARLDAGVYLIEAGLALAPIVSHLIAGEWRRAALFGAAPTAALLALVLVNAVPLSDPSAIRLQGTVATRAALGATLLVSFLSSGIGLIDSLLAGERARERRLTVVPTIGQGQVGLAVGSAL